MIGPLRPRQLGPDVEQRSGRSPWQAESSAPPVESLPASRFRARRHFQADTDDVRGAPSLTLIPMPQDKAASVRVYDPHAGETTAQLSPGVTWCGSALEAVDTIKPPGEDSWHGIEWVTRKIHLATRK